MSINLIIELFSVAFGLLFLVLLIRENIWCWPFGVVSSALSVYLFIDAKLYSEAVLYAFYVVAGIYGWSVWGSGKAREYIQRWSVKRSLPFFIIGVIGALGLNWFFSTQTDAANPAVDATTTSFSFVATYLEVHKVLSSWFYWIAVNAISVWLYQSRGLEIYSGLMVLYFFLSIYGWYEWNKRYKSAFS
ncbi:MAG: nicotinamide riboside transporter PnuC [Salibacteraceae bacterium]